MKWLEIDVENLFKWRKKVDKIALSIGFLYLICLMVLMIFTPMGDKMNTSELNSFVLFLIPFSPVLVILGGSIVMEKILQKIEYKAYNVQALFKLCEILKSETIQYRALIEQVNDGGYFDDEYFEQFLF